MSSERMKSLQERRKVIEMRSLQKVEERKSSDLRWSLGGRRNVFEEKRRVSSGSGG